MQDGDLVPPQGLLKAVPGGVAVECSDPERQFMDLYIREMHLGEFDGHAHRLSNERGITYNHYQKRENATGTNNQGAFTFAPSTPTTTQAAAAGDREAWLVTARTVSLLAALIGASLAVAALATAG